MGHAAKKWAKNDPTRIAGFRAAIKLKVVLLWAQKLCANKPPSLQNYLKVLTVFTILFAASIVEGAIDAAIRLKFLISGSSVLYPWRWHRNAITSMQMQLFYKTRIVDPFNVLHRLEEEPVVFASTHYHGGLDRLAIQVRHFREKLCQILRSISEYVTWQNENT